VEQLLTDTNAQRKAAGLQPLTLNPELSAAAAAKASDMFAKNYWAHNSPTGATPWDFIIGSGYHYTVAGENLAKNFSDSQAVVDAWMASPSHRANIVKPTYEEIGFAVVNGTLNGEETTLVVQMFGASPGAPVAAKPPAEPLRPVILPEVAAQKVSAAESTYQDVTKQPIFNIPTVSRDIVFAFMGIMMGVLLVDALVAGRKHVFRIAGHNIAHIMFLTAMFILLSGFGRGVLL
jgi:hypothetical protein